MNSYWQLTWTLRGLDLPHWAIWLTHSHIVFLTPTIAFRTRYEFLVPLLNGSHSRQRQLRLRVRTTLMPHHGIICVNSALVRRSTNALALPRRRPARSQISTLAGCFIVANAIAALFQICGAVAFYILSLTDQRINHLRQSILLVRLYFLIVHNLTRTGLHTCADTIHGRSVYG